MGSTRRAAFIDCVSGASGDMFLGALLDCGLPLDDLRRELGKVDLPAGSYSIDSARVTRGVISATKAIVRVAGDRGSEVAISHGHVHQGREAGGSHVLIQGPQHGHGHEHAHGHEHEHPHDHEHSHGHEHPGAHGHENEHGHSHEHGRSLRSILDLLARSRLNPLARDRATSIFKRLGEAEARVHGTTVADVIFHEVGAVDAIVDVVGTAIGFTLLGVDRFFASEIPLGSGEVECQHGRLPVPAPAVVNLLHGAHVRFGAGTGERVTPTGAAILAALVTDFDAQPRLRIERAGFGAGDRDTPDRPNVLRVVVGTESELLEAASSRVAVLETNLDDASPQVIAHAMERLLESGALDAFAEPIQMKKGRLGVKLSVIVELHRIAETEAILFRETPTFGIRRHECDRTTLRRDWRTVETAYGPARVKIGRLGDVEVRAPEYDDCRQLAEKSGASIRDVMDAVADAARRAIDPARNVIRSASSKPARAPSAKPKDHRRGGRTRKR
ncbi:MAG: nickel pincer cofactor biosynthesis protein LarC [Planctomycetes bacterium]|nr:nickel pincer cofactor biosynthesis protein LarC [Planctomycetota bacterium]MBI3847949.1 nickel pincer cofactor biosynthesis protein LarC [Planctomycetota bacterium]